MRFFCDAAGDEAWFRLETADEAAAESRAMRHAVEKFFRRAEAQAVASFTPASTQWIEQEIGLKAHVQREMPRFLSLRGSDGVALVTAMIAPQAGEPAGFCPILVGPENADPYPAHGAAIGMLARQLGIPLERSQCYPYRR